MALHRRTGQRFQASIWPGFVDAMTGLLLVLMFVLTIFTVIQFVLMETISGQEDEMSELSLEVAALADALGLERNLTAQLTSRVGGLEQTLEDAEAQVAAQTAMIASLRNDLTMRTNALADANARITAFEDQVAALLSEKATALGRIADLEASEADLMSEQEALNLALATAREEIDAQVEAARLAAAREEALQALVADLRTQNAETDESLANALAQLSAEEDKAQSLSQELMDTLARLDETEGALAEEEKAKLAEQAAIAALRERLADTEAALSEEEKAKLAEAAAAEALRKRLENAQTELTAMTLALEAKRKEAEETLTLLAAARLAEDGLNEKLAAALLANAELDLELKDTQSALQLAQQDRETTADLADQLARAIEAKLAAESDVLDQSSKLTEAEKTLEELRVRLADALIQQQKAEDAAASQMSEAEKTNTLLAAAREELSTTKTKSEAAQRELELLNQQVADLRVQMGKLQTLIDEAEAKDIASQVQITSLGSRLNTALTRAAAEERRRRQAEEEINALLQAEKDRLEQENEALAKYRSDFFGRLRELIGDRDGVQIVGDRFVFSSEVLFPSGMADLSDAGKDEIANVASLLLDIQDEIPPELDWVIRVDGHTDNIRVLPGGEFADNWELSQARALSVVRNLVGLGLRPDRLSANGFGQYQPINPANTAEARAQNRRIELKLTER